MFDRSFDKVTSLFKTKFCEMYSCSIV